MNLFLLISSSADAHLGFFHFLAIVNKCWYEHRYTNICFSPAFNYFGYIPRSGATALYNDSMFNILRDCHSIFHSGCTILLSYQQCIRISISPHPCRYCFFLFLSLFIMQILMGGKWHIIVELIYIPLMISDMHFFSCLLIVNI